MDTLNTFNMIHIIIIISCVCVLSLSFYCLWLHVSVCVWFRTVLFSVCIQLNSEPQRVTEGV